MDEKKISILWKLDYLPVTWVILLGLFPHRSTSRALLSSMGTSPTGIHGHWGACSTDAHVRKWREGDLGDARDALRCACLPSWNRKPQQPHGPRGVHGGFRVWICGDYPTGELRLLVSDPAFSSLSEWENYLNLFEINT